MPVPGSSPSPPRPPFRTRPAPCRPVSIATLADLISIPSVNPMGRDLDGPEYLEYKVTEYLENLFKRRGAQAVSDRPPPRQYP